MEFRATWWDRQWGIFGERREKRNARSHQHPEGYLARRCTRTARCSIQPSARCLRCIVTRLSDASEISQTGGNGMNERPTWVVHSRSVRDRCRDVGACIVEARRIREALLGIGEHHLTGSEYEEEGGRHEGGHSKHIPTQEKRTAGARWVFSLYLRAHPQRDALPAGDHHDQCAGVRLITRILTRQSMNFTEALDLRMLHLRKVVESVRRQEKKGDCKSRRGQIRRLVRRGETTRGALSIARTQATQGPNRRPMWKIRHAAVADWQTEMSRVWVEDTSPKMGAER
jgi:hypothetical protein